MHKQKYTFGSIEKIFYYDWSLLGLIAVLCTIGIIALYSAGQSDCVNGICRTFGSWTPWAKSQLSKIIAGWIIMLISGLFSPKFFVRFSYILFVVFLIVLLIVSISGSIGMGAQRWISIVGFKFQPSELAKITLILSLSRYFASYNISKVNSILYILPPIIMVSLYVVPILLQPDLGTALMLIISSGVIFFLSGISWKKFAVVFLIAGISAPIIWQYGLHDYQKRRIEVFLNPEIESRGAGYHITQSKIAMGSGGIFGKGYLNGSQSQLNFLPEKHTDFIFTIIAEEFGLIGCTFLLIIYLMIIYRCFKISLMVRSQFSKLLVMGLGINFFLYVFINMGMTIGLMPVVGVPLPFISYGGTAMIVLLFSFGLIQSAYIHKDILISGKGVYE